jgi:peroxiredoxin
MRTILISILCATALFGAGELSNRRAPSFSLPDSRGRQHDILDYRGKVLIVDFMKTDCPHCIDMTAALEEAKLMYGDKLEVLSVVVYPQDTAETAAAYMAKYKMSTPIVFDCGVVTAAYLNSGSFATPHVFIIDGQGHIRNDFDYGPMTESLFEGKGLISELAKWVSGMAKPVDAPPKKK